MEADFCAKKRHQHACGARQHSGRTPVVCGEVKMFASAPTYAAVRSEEHTSELQSLMRISYAVFCLKKKNATKTKKHTSGQHTGMMNTAQPTNKITTSLHKHTTYKHTYTPHSHT